MEEAEGKSLGKKREKKGTAMAEDKGGCRGEGSKLEECDRGKIIKKEIKERKGTATERG